MKNKLFIGAFMILVGIQFICMIKPLGYYGFEMSYIPSVLIIILGVLQILVPLLQSIYGNKETK